MEIGYTFLSRACWGRGHNREMKRLMVGHALESVARVDFRAGEENCRSRRALEKIGARLAPFRSERLEHGGREIVHLYYELCRADYVASLGAD
ncbi:MAG: GNAT family protein [Alteraurantiacibacter sp. bin_em_oilr2.035]|nr:GNAT family protein [Aurantiacibacter atlanticus]MDF1835953.1 GNAT family protein [Alteraurantiacibacter sp. bin_em_oilr2.035]